MKPRGVIPTSLFDLQRIKQLIPASGEKHLRLPQDTWPWTVGPRKGNKTGLLEACMLIPPRQVGPSASHNWYDTSRNNRTLSVTQQRKSFSSGKSLDKKIGLRTILPDSLLT